MKIIKIPSSQGGLGKADGAELAPDMILKELKDLFYKESGTNPELEIGSIEVAESDFEKTCENIYTQSKQFLAEPAIFLGGDHSITFNIVKAFSEIHKDSGVIIFDAHPDAENDFTPPTQEDLLPAMLNIGIKPENIILIGTRNWDKNEIDFLNDNKIKYFNMLEIASKGINKIAEELINLTSSFTSIYVSIDIDVLDPAFAPGTGYSEPGGLSTRELLTLTAKLKQTNKVKAWDIMEINPKKDINNLTSKVGAKLIKEIA